MVTAIGIGLLVPVFLLLVGTRGTKIHVPDVRGQTEAAAEATLQRAGLAVSGVSYEPVTQGQAGVVIRTIPGAGSSVARASKVHVIASAFAAPTPTPTSDVVPVTPRAPRHPKGHGKAEGD
jgi:beta-lactam-binding protein with PASTA domain